MKYSAWLISIGLLVTMVAVALFLWLDPNRDYFGMGFKEGSTATIEEYPTLPETTKEAKNTKIDDSQDGSQVDSQPPPIAPSFDVMRVDESGHAVIAGRSEPKDNIIILDHGQEIGRVVADNRGEWVFIPDESLKVGARSLSLQSSMTNLTQEGSPLILVVPEQKGEPVLALKPRIEGGSVLLQGPNSDPVTFSIDLSELNSNGELFFAGRSDQKGTVQLYLDNKPLGQTTATPATGWNILVSDHGKGEVLRADLLNDQGRVIARIEVPFDKHFITLADGSTVQVEKGNSLWRIARRIYGEGEAYTVIYAANKDYIKDPDLIYPGQLLNLPSR